MIRQLAMIILAFGVGVAPAVADTTKFVDRQNGFSVYHGADWITRQPNEKVTKLVVVSPVGNRCWVIVIDNPMSTRKNAKKIVEWLVNNPKSFERQLKKHLGEVHVAEVRPVILSGTLNSALGVARQREVDRVEFGSSATSPPRGR